MMAFFLFAFFLFLTGSEESQLPCWALPCRKAHTLIVALQSFAEFESAYMLYNRIHYLMD